MKPQLEPAVVTTGYSVGVSQDGQWLLLIFRCGEVASPLIAVPIEQADSLVDGIRKAQEAALGRN